MRVILLLVTAAIAYGSLFPFDFRWQAADRAALEGLIALWGPKASYGDALANVVLFLPFGFFAMLALGGRGATWPRVAVLRDAVLNVVGAALGVVVAPGLARRVRRVVVTGRAIPLAPAVLVGLWLIVALYPYVPGVDWQAIKDGLKPLLRAPVPAPEAVARAAVAWLTAGCLMSGPWPWPHAARAFAVLVALTLALKVVIVGNALSASHMAGAILALVLAAALRRDDGRWALVTVVAIAALVLYQGLAPFQFVASPRSFGWLPFAAVLDAEASARIFAFNALAVTFKAYLYGAAITLLARNGASWAMATIAVTVLLATIEVAQLHLLGHVPEITDPLIAAVFGLVLARLARTREYR